MKSLRKRVWDRLRLNFFLYPGISGYRAPDFLHPYYDWRRRRMGPLRIAANGLVWLWYQWWLPRRLRKVAAHWDKPEEWQARILPLAREWMTDPEDFATFDIVSEAQLRKYQRRMEQVGVIRTIEGAATDHAEQLLDKAKFHARCAEFGLATPVQFARIVDGSADWLRKPAADDALLVKPARGSGGHGIFTATGNEFRDDRLPEPCRTGAWLVQERLLAHPGIADLAMDALPTLRLTTIRNEQGEPELVSAALRFAAQADVAVDNGHAGGLVAPMDRHTGKLGTGLSGWGPGSFPQHPATGAAIAGRVVPCWEEACQLVRDAHARAYPDHVIIGWDVGIASSGASLIEANQRPAVRLTQRTAGKGIGEMRYGELLAWHLDRAISRDDARKMRVVREG